MPVYDASKVNEHFVEAMNDGDIDRALEVWTDETVFVTPPGTEPARGASRHRVELSRFLDLSPRLTARRLQFIEAGDIAFESVAWTLEGTDDQGNVVSMSGVECNVLRRLADGRWVSVIDNPFYGAHAGVGTSE